MTQTSSLSAADVPRAIGRLFVIAAICAGTAGAYALGRLALQLTPRANRRRRAARWAGGLIRRAVVPLGPSFVKIGQILSTRADLLGPELAGALRPLQERHKPAPFAAIERSVARSLGAPIEATFAAIDATPVAVGSVAQVHRAQLVDGRVVAIKVLRPGVRARLARDGRALRLVARLASLHPRARLSDPRAHMNELIDALTAQTDLVKEAENYEIFRRNFAAVSAVRFPEVHAALTRPDLLVMSFVDGQHLDDVRAEARDRVARLVRSTFLKMCFDDGFVHADLHPGNMRVTADDQLVLFDVGLVKRMRPAFLDQFVDFSRCLIAADAAELAAHLRKFHSYLAKVDWTVLEQDLRALMGRLAGKSMAEIDSAAFSNDIFALFRKHGIRPVPEIAVVLLGSMTLDGVTASLAPERNAFADMALFLCGALMRREAARQAAALPVATTA
jgi:ubiquinone biosynthesis protein